MENALLISLSRQIALQRRMDVIANNMANVGTSGYKADGLVFEEYIMPVARMTEHPSADGRLSYVQDSFTYLDFAEGGFEQTGNELDVAINGDGWFVVRTPQGERFTRNGQFKLNNDGLLVTNEGFPVLGEGGPISFTSEEVGIAIAGDGTISSSEGQKDKLRVVHFENTAGIRKEGATLYKAEGTPERVETPRLAQGMVEKSNVNPVIELTRMIDTVRAYTSVAQAIKKTDELRSDAIERLGSTNIS